MIHYGKKQGFIATYQGGVIKLTDCGRKYTLQAYQELIDAI